MKKIERIRHLLEKAYGKPKLTRHNPPLDELILTILSQNTTAANCRRAFDGLRKAFPTWDDVRNGCVTDIADSIRSGGLADIKADRMRRLLQQIHDHRGNLDFSWIEELPSDEARDYLLRFDGVGPKTAACVLLFSLGRPVMPVDTHVHRVSLRVGLIPSNTTAEAAHKLLQEMIPPERVYSFHINMVRHGREVCRPSNPKCDICVLSKECDFGRQRL